jgi:hypothetical protein
MEQLRRRRSASAMVKHKRFINPGRKDSSKFTFVSTKPWACCGGNPCNGGLESEVTGTPRHRPWETQRSGLYRGRSIGGRWISELRVWSDLAMVDRWPLICGWTHGIRIAYPFASLINDRRSRIQRPPTSTDSAYAKSNLGSRNQIGWFRILDTPSAMPTYKRALWFLKNKPTVHPYAVNITNWSWTLWVRP